MHFATIITALTTAVEYKSIMSSRRITKSHSENLSSQQQVRVNGVAPKRNLMKQEEIDLTSENQCNKERTVKSAHSISICINTFDEVPAHSM